MQRAGTSLVTTLPAAIVENSPMVTPGLFHVVSLVVSSYERFAQEIVIKEKKKKDSQNRDTGTNPDTLTNINLGTPASSLAGLELAAILE